jgi:hypothetical protein
LATTRKVLPADALKLKRLLVRGLEHTRRPTDPGLGLTRE